MSDRIGPPGVARSHGDFSRRDAFGTVPDLLGAVALVRRSGAAHVVLVGASLGGIIAGKVAAQAGAEAVVILSAVRSSPGTASPSRPATWPR